MKFGKHDKVSEYDHCTKSEPQEVEYRVGDLLLAEIPYLKECEIKEIAVEAKCMNIDGIWYKAEDVKPKIKTVLGRAMYKKGWFGSVKRTVEYV